MITTECLILLIKYINMKEININIEKMRCVQCRASLHESDLSVDSIECPSCHSRFRVLANGAVDFIGGDSIALLHNQIISQSDSLISRIKNCLKKRKTFYNFLMYFFGTSCLNKSPYKFLKDNSKTDSLILNLGSGTQKKFGKTINIDILPWGGVDILADMRNLPFNDQSVDLIICTSVLEHMIDSPAAIKEMHRVLKNDGKLYIDVPFIYPFHSSPGDYFRWTAEGVKYLINPLFHATEVGVRHGPTSAFLMILASWLSIIFSFGSNRLYQFINIVLILILAPFGHIFDFLFGRFSSSHNIAAGFYIIGEKTG